MSTALKSPPHTDEPARGRRKRSAWRQRLVEAERGVTLGFRGDSTLFVHFFFGSIILAAAILLGLSLIEWAILTLGLTLVLAGEMFNKAMATIGRQLPDDADGALHDSLKIGTGAVFVTIIGTLLAIGLIFARRVGELFAS